MPEFLFLSVNVCTSELRHSTVVSVAAQTSQSRGGCNVISFLPFHPGGYPTADGRVHLLSGAGEDAATAAEHTAEALHPGETRPGGTRASSGVRQPLLWALCLKIFEINPMK